MPRIRVELVEGRTLDQKRRMAAAVTEAAVDIFGVEPDAVTVRFEEVPAHNMAKGGRLRSESDDEGSEMLTAELDIVYDSPDDRRGVRGAGSARRKGPR